MIYLLDTSGVGIPIGAATDVTSSVTGTAPAQVLNLQAALGQSLGMNVLTAGAFTATASLRVTYP
ncbi:hypothetical protein D3C78_1611260 [compost metagenome]